MSVSVLHNGNNGYTDPMGGSIPYGSASTVPTTDFSEADVDGAAAQSFFVRALFDFTGQDTSSLSFKRGDVIEVLNTLPSGWWDGLLDDERGWFPSNYVQAITEHEAEAELSLRLGLQQQPPLDPQLDRQQQQLEQQRLLQQQQQQQRAQLDQRQYAQQRQQGQGQQHGPYDEDTQWLDDDDDQPPLDPGARAPSQPSDFWVPQVTPDGGQIFYVNTITGEQSRFLPTEVDEAQRQEERPPAASRQRSATDASSSSSRGANSAGFGFNQRSGTPEPWIKRLADDGMSYYYVHAQTGHVRWTPPSPTSGPRNLHREDPNGRGTRIDPYNNGRTRTNSEAGRQLGQNMRRASVYSDHSEVNPYDDVRPTAGNVRPLPRPAPPTEAEEVLVHPLQIARRLQHELAPPPLPAITSYSEAACDAISAVVESFAERSRLASEQADPSEVVAQSAAMAHKVMLVVVAVRNLLYVSGTLTGPLPALANSHMGEDTDWVRSQIKPFQRKVTATLSKLVLSARAVNANPDWPATTSTGRVESDAAELERAVTTFVYEIQRSAASQRAKRLQGVLLPGEGAAGVGPGLIGAGTAGQWKGSGFVPLSTDRAYPLQRKLGREVVSELSNLRLQAEDKIAALFTSITQYKNVSLRSTPDYGFADVRTVSDRVILAGRLAIAQLSEFLTLAEDIDIAGYVDVEGYENVPEAYLEVVQKAREFVRTFETARQALYDDSSVVLMASQAIHVSLFGQGGQGPPEVVHAAIPALRENLGTLMETLELLLDIAQSQGEVFGARRMLHHSSQLGHSGNWQEQLQGEEIVELAEAIQAGGQPAPREAWAAQQPRTQQAYLPPPATSAAGGLTPTADQREGEVPPSASASTVTAPESTTPPSGAPDTTTSADEEELSDDEFDRKGRPKMGGNRQRERERIDRQADKLARIVGERPPDQWLQNKVQELAPWYLRPEHTTQSEIVLNPDGGVRAATLPALIERLTMHDGSDAKFNDTFMMTFKSFSSVDEVFDMLVARFNIQPPDGLTPEQLEEWRKVKKAPIRLRSINAIRKQIDSLEKDDLHILIRVKAFANDIFTTSPEMSGAAKNILHIVKRVEEGGLDGVRSLQPTVPEFPPPSILPRKSGKITKLLEIDALELARQLTILESELFFKIKQSDCIARSKESIPAGPDTIKSVINLANKMSDWVADAVLSREDPRRRAAVIKHFVAVAEKCRALNNFSTMAALIAGLNGPPIRRLKRTWEQVNARITSQLDDLEKTLDTAHNFTAYKSLLSSIQPPCVPFLGVYLTVLTFIQDGSKDILKDGGLINFQKRQKTADVIQEITKFQGQPYNLTKIQTIRAFIEESLANLDHAPDFWQLSLEREPREREDEKMARLLQESGFL